MSKEAIDVLDLHDQVDWTISDRDPILDPNDPVDAGRGPRGYARAGSSALRVLAAALLVADRPRPSSVLDFGCACGRVTRWMRAAFPDAALYVSDIMVEHMNWTANAFDATCWPSTNDFTALTPLRKVDLIWSGSVATHTSEQDTVALIEHFYDWLNPSGIAVVTTHGRRFVDFAQSGTIRYFAGPGELEPILAGMVGRGYGFAPHPGQNQGISGNTVDWLVKTVMRTGARVLMFGEHLYDNHQDVIAFQKV